MTLFITQFSALVKGFNRIDKVRFKSISRTIRISLRSIKSKDFAKSAVKGMTGRNQCMKASPVFGNLATVFRTNKDNIGTNQKSILLLNESQQL